MSLGKWITGFWEETHNARASGSNNISAAQAYANKHQQKSSKDYVDVSDDEVDVRKDPKKSLLKDEDDPFADPFADWLNKHLLSIWSSLEFWRDI